MVRSRLERFARSTLERNQHTVPWRSRLGELVPRALGPLPCVPGVGGMRLRGAPNGGCGGLGFGLGPGGDDMHQPGICPPVRRLGVGNPGSPSALTRSASRSRPSPHTQPPPKPRPCQQLATNRQCPPPPLFPLGGEDVGLRHIEHLHPLFGGGARLPASLPRPRQLRFPPSPPVDHP